MLRGPAIIMVESESESGFYLVPGDFGETRPSSEFSCFSTFIPDKYILSLIFPDEMNKKMKRKASMKRTVEEADAESSDEEQLSDDADFSEEEEDGLMSTDPPAEPASDAPPKKQAKLTQAELYKPPSSTELHQLQETENLFQSSLFRMQITELLGEISVTSKKKKQIEGFISQLRSHLTGLKEGPEQNLSDPPVLKKSQVQLPIILQPRKVKGRFKFIPPVDVKAVGSFVTGTAVKRTLTVDVQLTIPKDCFQPKDYLNQRYLRKRAFYLTYIAAKLQKSPLVDSMAFTYHHGNHMHPVLLVTPSAGHGKHFTVQLHAAPEPGVFKLSRFHVSKNNVRSNWFNQDDTAEESQTDAAEPATPHYNSSILQDLSMDSSTQLLQQHLEDAPSLREGILLLKVWLHQRELNEGQGAFSGFIMSCFVLYLLTLRKLNKVMSSYQVVRNTLLHLSQADWTSKGISLCKTAVDQAPQLEDFHKAFDVVFVDYTGYINLCAGMTRYMFTRVKHEAETSLQSLQTPGIDGFEMLFLRPVPFSLKFDQLLHITCPSHLQESCARLHLESRVMDYCGDFISAALPGLLDLLQQAIGRRTKLLHVQRKPHKMWPVTSQPPSFDVEGPLTIGLLLDPEFSSSVLDKGPVADSPEAKDFREFWGNKSELRRFQDGSICEAVVWKCKTLADRRGITGRIVKHVLERHAAIPRDTLSVISNQLDPLLMLPLSRKDPSIVYGTGEEQTMKVLHVYDELAKQLRNLKDLPLVINSVQGLDPVFRHAEVFPPVPLTDQHLCQVDGKRLVPASGQPTPPWVPAIKVQCVMEASGKWPDDLEAVRRLKAAFHVQLGQSLEDQHNLTLSVYPTHVDVYKEGLVFCVQLAYLKEIVLTKMMTTSEGMVKMVESEESAQLERTMVQVPRITSTLHGLQQQHGSFSSAVRLAKRWVCSQMLADFVCMEAVELTMAYLYLCPTPFTVPCSPLVAFQRWLHLLSNHDWNTTPLIVNLNNELKREDLTEIQNRFIKERSTLPIMFIATPLDKFQSAFTKRNPTPQILQRLVLLAKESAQLLMSQLQKGTSDFDPKQIFRPPLEVFDVIIHLDSHHCARQHEAVDLNKNVFIPSRLTPGGSHQKHKLPVVNFDPVQFYLQELRAALDEVALFFHDPLGGAQIAVLWKQPVWQPQPLKPSHVNCRMPDTSRDETDVQLIPNMEAIIEDMKIIGEGLVKRVEKIKKNPTISR